MYYIKIVIFFILHIYSLNLFSQTWSQKTSFPGGLRYLATAFAIGDTGYVGAGLSPEKLERDFWKYVPATDQWIQIDSLAGPARFDGFSFVIDGKGYIGGGGVEDDYPRNDLYEYDPATGKWTRKADFPIFVGSELTMEAFSINNKGYVVAQFNDNNFLEYNPNTNTWKTLENFPGDSKMDFVGFSYGNKGYVGCGFDGSEYINEIWEYNADKDQWRKMRDFPGTSTSEGVVFVIDKYAYLGLGWDYPEYLRDFWQYDMIENRWVQLDNSLYAAQGAFSMVVSNKGYVGAGLTALSSEFWEYTPLTASNRDLERNFLNLYPNPVKDILRIQNISMKDYTVRIYSLYGELKHVVFNSPTNIELSDLNEGLYVIELISDNNKISKIFLKK